MRAVCVTKLEGPGHMEVLDIERPMRRRGEILVEVRAVAPAFPDLLMSQGKYQVQPDLPFSPGSDFAGVVIDADFGSEFAVGDRVAGCLSYGAAAEVLSVSSDRLYPLPDDIDFIHGAALPMNYLTSHFALATRGDVQPGQWVMVLGASGGVGLASIQVAKGFGANVIAVVSDAQRADVALSAGADHALLREAVSEARELTGGHGIDVVVDVVGGDLVAVLRTLAPFGRVMIVGFASGEIPTVKVNRLLLTNTDVRGVESDYLWKHGISREAWNDLMRMHHEGWIRPVVHERHSWDSYGPVLENLSARAVIGRVVLSV